jgi:hypothetical protein
MEGGSTDLCIDKRIILKLLPSTMNSQVCAVMERKGIADN